MSGQRKTSFSIESTIDTVLGLIKIVRVVADLVSIKVTFSFIRESIRELSLYSIISRPVKLCA